MLALDAPVVALAWLWAVHAELGSRFMGPPALVLAVSVWLVYTFDRLIDASRIQKTSSSATTRTSSLPTRRHAFATSQRTSLAVLWGVLLAVDLVVAWRSMPTPSLLAGGAVAILAAATLGRRLRATRAGVVLRSGLVGVVFAGALAVCAGLGSGALELVPTLAAFALACATNVAFVASWEHGLDDGSGSPKLPSRVPSVMALVTCAVAAGLWLATGSLASACAGMAGFLLLVLDAVRERVGVEPARVWADVAMVVPLMALL